MRAWIVLLALLTTAGCERRQEWTFYNGMRLDDSRPPTIVAEVFDQGECGFACQPPGDRVYCEELARDVMGPPPSGLTDGERYCFMGTALDEEGNAYAVGCAVAEVGGEPIHVPLSPIADGRVIHRTCQLGPIIDFDAGPPVSLDAGPRMDAGPGGVDAGPPGFDAGPPRIDAGPGLPDGTPVRVTFDITGGGRVSFYDSSGRLMAGRSFGNGSGLIVDAYVGFYCRAVWTVDPGYNLTTFELPGCSPTSPCEFLFTGPANYDFVFTRQP